MNSAILETSTDEKSLAQAPTPEELISATQMFDALQKSESYESLFSKKGSVANPYQTMSKDDIVPQIRSYSTYFEDYAHT
jgi:hypothetical protein